MIYLVALLCGPPLYHLFRFFPVCAFLVLIISVGALAHKRRFVAVVLLAVGVLYGFARFDEGTLGPGFQGKATIQGYFTAPARELDGGFSQSFISQSGGYLGEIDVLTGKDFEVGARYDLKIKLYGPGGKINPGAWYSDPFAVLLDADPLEGSSGTFMVRVNRARDGIGEAIAAGMDPEAAALVTAVTTGERSGLTHELRESFRASGLAHLLSISGTHFGLIGVLLFGLVRAVLLRLPHRALEWLTRYLTPTEAAAVITFPSMLFYLMLSGARVPSVRSFIMMSLFLLGLLIGRKGKWLNFLAFAAVLLVYIQPQVMFGLSFQLSFLAVLFIGMAVKGGRFRALEVPDIKSDDEEDWNSFPLGKRMLKRAWIYIRTSLIISLAASGGVAPLVAYHFHYGSVMSPVANLLVTPLVCMVLVPLSLVSSVWHFLFGTYLLAAPVEWVAGISLSLVKWFGSLPFAAASIGPMPPAVPLMFYTGCLVWFVFRRRELAVLPLLPIVLWSLVALSSDRPLRVTFLDVGRADAAVVELPDGKNLVIDTAWRGTQVDNYLRYRGIRRIDALALSHGLKDHAGGVDRLVRRYNVGEIWDNGLIRYDLPLENITHRTLSRGMKVEGDGWKLTVLHPYEGFHPRGMRSDAVSDNSLVMRLNGRENVFLFAGDIEEAAVRDILHLGDRLKADVVKAPHHAMDSRALSMLLKAVEPRAVVVTGKSAPARSVKVLENHMVYVTGEVGAVKVEERNGELSINPFDTFRLKEADADGQEWKNIKRIFSVW